MRLKKWMLAWVPVLAATFICLFALPVQTQAATSGYYTYVVSNAEATITDCSENIAGDVVIPDKLGGFPVTAIGELAFYNCDGLTSVTIPASIATIGEDAFFSCDGITDVFVMDASAWCNIDFGNDYANPMFYGINLHVLDSTGREISYVVLDNTVSEIPEKAFYGCGNLTSITISYSVVAIGDYAFYSCDELTDVQFGYGIKTIGEYAFFNCDGLTEVVLPNSVRTIGTRAFYDCNQLTTLTIGVGVTSIGSEAFCNCSLPDDGSTDGDLSVDWEDFYTRYPLKDVNYKGNTVQKQNISMAGNDCLLAATWHYAPCTTHTYDNDCDEMCDVCGETRDVTHDYAAATCTAPKTCKDCGAEKGKALGHNADNGTVTKKATCTATGTKVFKCTRCPITVKTEVVAKSSHNYKDATCTAPKTCKACEATTGKALGHNAGNGTVTKQATCTATGTKAYKCTRCPVTVKTEVVAKSSHNYKDATCTAPKTCKACNATSGKALGHNAGNGTVTKQATCTATGTKAYKCTRCPVTVKTEVVAKSSHNYKDATCTAPKTCKACKATSGKALGHKYDNTCDRSCSRCDYRRTITHSYNKATCTEPKKCKICKYTSGNALGHSYDHGCDNTCNRCAAKRTTKHNYAKATCTKAKTCKNCGKTSGKKLGHDYETTLTKATLKKNGKEVKVCTRCDKEKTTTIYKIKSVKLSTTKYTYNGKAKKPSVTVKDSKGKKLKEGTDYTVTYDSGRKKVGEYEVEVKFKGEYIGTKTLTFTIVPKTTSIKKLTGKSKSLEVKLNLQTSQTSGYQIEYSTSKSFKSSKKVTITNNKTSKKTIKSLKKKTKYYVRIRTYKAVDGERFYSGWSDYKSVKTK